jgi:alpha-tubulin suppressor-like RCC1 family protein
MKKTFTVFVFIIYTLLLNLAFGQQCNFIDVSSKSGHSLGITEEGKLFSWGGNSQGQLGLGNKTTAELIPKSVNQESDWKKAETGQSSFFSIALKNNGSLWLWGGNFNSALGNYTNYLIPTQTAQNFKFKDFSAGYWRIMAIRDDNTLWGWGDNDAGCLGVGSTSNIITTPTQVGNEDKWSKVSCGLFFTLALKTDGTLWVCGSNNVGQLGNGTFGSGMFSNVFEQVGSENNWREILACAGSNLAIKKDGTLWAWGFNETSQLGDGTTINRLVPTQIGTDTDWQSLGYSGFSSAAIRQMVHCGLGV